MIGHGKKNLTVRYKDGRTEYYTDAILYGEGRFSRAYACLREGRRYLIKIFEYDNFREAETLRSKITVVKAAYSRAKDNYLLEDVAVGETDNEEGYPVTCQVFSLLSGATLEKTDWSKKSLQEKVDAYIDLLTGLSRLHSVGLLHMDCKPSNVYSFCVHGKVHYQLIDFGSAETVHELYERFSSRRLNAHLSRSSSRYYPDEEYSLLQQLVYMTDEQDFAKAAMTLDLSASARIFFEMLFPDQEEMTHGVIDKAVSAILYDGIREALASYFHKSLAPMLEERSCSAIEAIAALRDIAGAISDDGIMNAAVYGMRARSALEVTFYRPYRHLHDLPKDAAVSSDDVLADIEPILFPADPRNLESGNPFLCLVGEGGLGKTKLFHYIYLSSLKSTERAVLYVPLSKTEVSFPLEELENGGFRQAGVLRDCLLHAIDAVMKQTTGRHFDALVAPCTVLLDAYDELPARRALVAEDEKNGEAFDRAFVEAIEAMCAERDVRVVMTSRFAPCGTASGSVWNLNLLSDDVKHEYLTRHLGTSRASEIAHAPVYAILNTPILLSAACKTAKEGRDVTLLDNEYALFTAFFDTMYRAKRKPDWPIECAEMMDIVARAVSTSEITSTQELATRHFLQALNGFLSVEKQTNRSVYSASRNEKPIDYLVVECSHDRLKAYFKARSVYLSFKEASSVNASKEKKAAFRHEIEFSDGFYCFNIDAQDMVMQMAGQAMCFCEREIDLSDRIYDVQKFMHEVAEFDDTVVYDPIRMLGLALHGDFGRTDIDLGWIDRIPPKTFAKCQLLETMVLPQKLRTIGFDAFSQCKNLRKIVLSPNVCSIGDTAFDDCEALENIEIPYGVQKIGRFAFRNCRMLSSICFPASVTEIEIGVCSGCESLISIIVAKENPIYRSVGNCLIDTTIETLICGCATSVIPCDGSVFILDACAFESQKIKRIIIPYSVGYIDKTTFRNCSTVSEIVVEEGNRFFRSEGNCLIEMASGTLIRGCNHSAIPLDGSVTSIGEYAFDHCELREIVIPASIIRISPMAFNGCSCLESVTFEDKSCLNDIGEFSFFECSSLSCIEIPACVEKIEGEAFCMCTSLKKVIFERGSRMKSIGQGAFGSCTSLSRIKIPSSVKTIEDDAFCNCTSLSSITILSGVESIGDSAFASCESLLRIKIPNSVKSVGEGLFASCTSLSSIKIPTSITEIGYDVFCGCSSLSTVFYDGDSARFTKICKDSLEDSLYGEQKVTVYCKDGTFILHRGQLRQRFSDDDE